MISLTQSTILVCVAHSMDSGLAAPGLHVFSDHMLHFDTEVPLVDCGTHLVVFLTVLFKMFLRADSWLHHPCTTSRQFLLNSAKISSSGVRGQALTSWQARRCRVAAKRSFGVGSCICFCSTSMNTLP